jgi:hypothetical protein
VSRHRLEKYLDKVFGFSDLVSALPEGRQSPRHSWKKVFEAVFLGSAMQIPSLLQIEAECRDGSLAKRIGPISDDTLGYALQRQSPEPVFALGCENSPPPETQRDSTFRLEPGISGGSGRRNRNL